MKTFTSSDARWPGTIVTGDFLNWKQLEMWAEAIKEAQAIPEPDQNAIRYYSVLMPVALNVIKEWHIEGLPEKIDSIESVPASTEFVAWFVSCVSELWTSTNQIEKN